MAGLKRRLSPFASAWPGFVDVLSALLMVVIFVLLIFTFSQSLLSNILSKQQSELGSLHKKIAEISRELGLEREQNQALRQRVVNLSGIIDSLTSEKKDLRQKVKNLEVQNKQDKSRIKNQLAAIASLQQDINGLRSLKQELEKEIENLAASLDKEKDLTKKLRDRSKALQAELANEKETTLLAQKKIEKKDIRIQILQELVNEQEKALKEEKSLKAGARLQVSLLNQKISHLQSQLEKIGRALGRVKEEKENQKAEIKDLKKRLNIALARRVNRLQEYRSEFFGRLKKILGENPNISVKGDRFLLQAELLFASGSAKLGKDGKEQLARLAKMVIKLIEKLPSDIEWILRIDGHTDCQSINSDLFASNWELSTDRALSVIHYLAEQGIPENRMAAAGFSKYHPVNQADNPEAYRQNRRIEITLTSR
ncbi:MAG: OmpA family protein [Thermodesulfobacteriota bacterium]